VFIVAETDDLRGAAFPLDEDAADDSIGHPRREDEAEEGMMVAASTESRSKAVEAI